MTPHELAQILQNPHAVPDSDDEEDDRERKVVSCLPGLVRGHAIYMQSCACCVRQQ